MISLAAVVSTTVFPVVESITTPFFSSRAISTDPLLREILESFVTGVADVTVISFAFVCFAESAATTVILTVFVVLPALTVIVTSPALTPVTTPFASTVASVASLDVYVTFVLAGLTVAVICSVAPTATSLAAFTDNAGFLTVIVAFKLVALPFLGVTLTQYRKKSYCKECDKMGIIHLEMLQNTIEK